MRPLSNAGYMQKRSKRRSVCNLRKKGGKFRDYSTSPVGLVCSVCGGGDGVEPFSLKLQNRFCHSLLWAFFCSFGSRCYLFVLFRQEFRQIYWVRRNPYRADITGYYFGGKQIEFPPPHRVQAPRPPQQNQTLKQQRSFRPNPSHRSLKRYLARLIPPRADSKAEVVPK